MLGCAELKITLHPFLIYEGTDCRENLEVTLGKLTPQFKQIEGEFIVVDGRRLKMAAMEISRDLEISRVLNF